MKRQGKRSAEDLTAAEYTITLEPPRRLSPAERAIWDAVLSSGDRFTKADAILIAQYCSACVDYNKSRTLVDRERAGRLCLSYATRLRLTPASRYDARAAARAANNLEGVAGDDPLLGGTAWPHN